MFQKAKQGRKKKGRRRRRRRELIVVVVDPITVLNLGHSFD